MLTAGEITEKAINELRYRNCFVWRNNNISVRGRKFIGLKGVPDIVGFHIITGAAVYCEVKTANDRLSKEQKEFLSKAKESGCHVLLATEAENKFILKGYESTH